MGSNNNEVKPGNHRALTVKVVPGIKCSMSEKTVREKMNFRASLALGRCKVVLVHRQLRTNKAIDCDTLITRTKAPPRVKSLQKNRHTLHSIP